MASGRRKVTVPQLHWWCNPFMSVLGVFVYIVCLVVVFCLFTVVLSLPGCFYISLLSRCVFFVCVWLFWVTFCVFLTELCEGNITSHFIRRLSAPAASSAGPYIRGLDEARHKLVLSWATFTDSHLFLRSDSLEMRGKRDLFVSSVADLSVKLRSRCSTFPRFLSLNVLLFSRLFRSSSYGKSASLICFIAV